MRKRVRAARGYGEWVRTAALAEAERGPATPRREIESRKSTTYNTQIPLSHTMWEQSNPHRVEDRTATLLR